MMHRAWSSIVEVPYCFSRSNVKFQGHTALKIFEFDPNCAFPDCNSSLNSPMAMKCCTKLETAKERCPIVFQGHPSNFKVTRYKTSPILTQIGRFLTIGRSQLSNPSDLPCSSLVLKKVTSDYFNLWWPSFPMHMWAIWLRLVNGHGFTLATAHLALLTAWLAKLLTNTHLSGTILLNKHQFFILHCNFFIMIDTSNFFYIYF